MLRGAEIPIRPPRYIVDLLKRVTRVSLHPIIAVR